MNLLGCLCCLIRAVGSLTKNKIMRLGRGGGGSGRARGYFGGCSDPRFGHQMLRIAGGCVHRLDLALGAAGTAWLG